MPASFSAYTINRQPYLRHAISSHKENDIAPIKREIENIRSGKEGGKEEKSGDNIFISLTALFKQLKAIEEKHKNNPLTDNDQLAIEQCKLDILELVVLNQPSSPTPKPPETSSWSSWLKNKVIILACGLLITSGLGLTVTDAFNSSGSFISYVFQSFLSGGPLLDTIGFLFAVASTILFFSFETRNIMKSLGISSAKNYDPILDIHKKKLKAMKALNSTLLENTPINEDMASIAKLGNSDIKIQEKIFSHEESGKKRFFRYVFLGLGIILAASSAFFLAKTYLLMYAPKLLETFIGDLMLTSASLTFGYIFNANQAKQFFNWVNPDAKKIDTLKKDYGKFVNKYATIDDRLDKKIDHEKENIQLKHENRALKQEIASYKSRAPESDLAMPTLTDKSCTTFHHSVTSPHHAPHIPLDLGPSNAFNNAL